MRFPPALLDEIRARLPVSQVVARRVQLRRAGREYKGLSPFKSEKTPSFTGLTIAFRADWRREQVFSLELH
jgi:DNA primase